MRLEIQKKLDRLRWRHGWTRTWGPLFTVLFPIGLVVTVYELAPDARLFIVRFVLFGLVLTTSVPVLLAVTYWLLGIDGWREMANRTLGHYGASQKKKRWRASTHIECPIAYQSPVVTADTDILKFKADVVSAGELPFMPNASTKRD